MSYWSDQKYGTGANGLHALRPNRLRAAAMVRDDSPAASVHPNERGEKGMADAALKAIGAAD